MDKAKNLAKGGWHPAGDKQIHRKTWKSDLKGVATGKSNDPAKKHYENAISHQSAPLQGLKDPDSFGPPPKHREYYDEQGKSLNPVAPTAVSRYTGPEKIPGQAGRQGPGGGWGSVIPTPNRKQQEEEQKQQEEEARANRGPYRADTTGLATNNLPAPPVRRGEGQSLAPAPLPRNVGSPTSPPVPQRQPQARAAPGAPPPVLPPRMNDHPDEYTPPPPPTYQEAAKAASPDPAALNTGAVNNLGRAGVSVPGFGIGGNSTGAQQTPSSPQGHSGQLSELQQRFARMRSTSDAETTPASQTSSNAAAAAAAKKPPPPPPPKKPNLAGATTSPPGSSNGAPAPPPLPMASKPRPN